MILKKGFSVVILLVLLTITSCKPKGFIAEAKATKPMKAEKLIRSHYELDKDFKTAYIKADVSYKDPKESLNLSADIRVQKNEKILINSINSSMKGRESQLQQTLKSSEEIINEKNLNLKDSDAAKADPLLRIYQSQYVSRILGA